MEESACHLFLRAFAKLRPFALPFGAFRTSGPGLAPEEIEARRRTIPCL